MLDGRPTILFVDDEQAVLDGLYRRLWEYEDQWRMMFAVNAATALRMMDEHGVDVVITDLRMPGMDGAALLHEVSRRHPMAVRFVLSGYSDRDAIFRAVGPAHQYFVKPCDPEILAKAVSHALAIRKRLHSPELFALISGAKSIPAMPHALAELAHLLQSPTTSMAELARVISGDVGLTTQLLKLVNSAYFVLPMAVNDVFQAIKLLGFELVRSLVMLGAVFETFQHADIDVAAVKRMEQRSLMIGAVARDIAEAEHLDHNGVQYCQCAGMLSHVGSLILLANRPVQMADIQAQLDRSEDNVIDLEQRAFGASHPEVGACLLSLWGFCDGVVEAVLYHHHPHEADPNFIDRLDPVAVVHVAQHLVKPVRPGSPRTDHPYQGVDHDYLWRVGAIDRLDKWADIAALSMRKMDAS